MGRVQGRLGRIALASPTAILVVGLVLAPLILTFVTSFARADIVTFDISYTWNLDSYRALADGIYTKTLLRSLALSLGATAGAVIVALPIAFLMSQASARARLVILALVAIPFWTSFVIRTYAWENVLLALGLERQIGSVWVVEVGMIVTYLPFAVLPIAASLGRLDRSTLDAAGDLGAHGWRLLRRVVLPLSRRGIAAAALLVGIPATGEVIVPQVLGGGKTLLAGNVLQSSFQLGDRPLGSALALALMVALLLYAGLARIIGGRA